MEDRILQVSGFGVASAATTQWNFALVALTANGRVLLSRRAGEWHDVGPKDRAEGEKGEG